MSVSGAGDEQQLRENGNMGRRESSADIIVHFRSHRGQKDLRLRYQAAALSGCSRPDQDSVSSIWCGGSGTRFSPEGEMIVQRLIKGPYENQTTHETHLSFSQTQA